MAISESFLADDNLVRSLTASYQLGKPIDPLLVPQRMLHDGLLKAGQLHTTYEEVLKAIDA